MQITSDRIVQTSCGETTVEELEKASNFFTIIVPYEDQLWEAHHLKGRLSKVTSENTNRITEIFYKFNDDTWKRHGVHHAPHFFFHLEDKPPTTYSQLGKYFAGEFKHDIALKLFIKSQDFTNAAKSCYDLSYYPGALTFSNLALTIDPLNSQANELSGNLLLKGADTVKPNLKEGYSRLKNSLIPEFESRTLMTVATLTSLHPELGKFYEVETYCRLVLGRSNPLFEHVIEANFLLAFIYATPNPDLELNYPLAIKYLSACSHFIYRGDYHFSYKLSMKLLAEKPSSGDHKKFLLRLITRMVRSISDEVDSDQKLYSPIIQTHQEELHDILLRENMAELHAYLRNKFIEQLKKMDECTIATLYNEGNYYVRTHIAKYLDKLLYSDTERFTRIGKLLTKKPYDSLLGEIYLYGVQGNCLLEEASSRISIGRYAYLELKIASHAPWEVVSYVARCLELSERQFHYALHRVKKLYPETDITPYLGNESLQEFGEDRVSNMIQEEGINRKFALMLTLDLLREYPSNEIAKRVKTRLLEEIPILDLLKSGTLHDIRNPYDPELLLKRADYFFKAGNKAYANELCQKILEIEPNNNEAQKLQLNIHK